MRPNLLLASFGHPAAMPFCASARAQMESWSTYKTQHALNVHREARKGGGEGENYQIGMEMRGQEIKRKAGGGLDLYIFLFWVEIVLFTFIFVIQRAQPPRPPIPAGTVHRWDSFWWLKREKWISYTLPGDSQGDQWTERLYCVSSQSCCRAKKCKSRHKDRMLQ